MAAGPAIPVGTAARARTAGRGQAPAASTAARGGDSWDGMLASLPPSPRLVAQLAALPPAERRPARGPGQGPPRPSRKFTLRKLLRPFLIALVAGLILDGLDALATLALPALIRGGIDNGVQAKAFHAIVFVSLVGLAIVLADWVVEHRAEDDGHRAWNGERLLYALRIKIIAHLQRHGLDFYERELSPGRIMTWMDATDVATALSSFLQTGLVTAVSSVLSFFGVLAALLDHQPQAWA